MRRVIEKNLKWVVTILALAAVAAAVAGYILINQGVRLPWEDAPVRMTAVLDNAQAVTPGQGQQVQVAGVKVGKIATVDLRDGRAVVGLDVERKFVDRGLIRTDARALLRPRTPLKDMYIQLLPGSMRRPAAKAGFEIPVSRTLTDVDLDEILASLDERTMDYVTLLVGGAARGLKGQGEQLAEVFRRYRPTVRDLARVNRAVSHERGALRRLVTSLAELNGRLARKPRDLSQLVSASEATFGAFASEDTRLRETVQELPATLDQATKTLGDIRPLARELGPATAALTPAMRALDRANQRVRPAARRTEPVVRRQVRPFVREARPLVRDLAPAAVDLSQTFPELRRAGRVLNRFFNMLTFNKGGKQAPGAEGRDEGYLYWLAWTAHNGSNLINIDDANGPLRPVFLTGTCGTLTSLVNDFPAAEFLLGLSPVLEGICGDPNTASLSKSRSLKRHGLAKGGDR